MMVHRPGSRFGPSDLGAVRRYLRNKVERNENECIKTMDVYENEPWLLDHVSTPLFKDNEWYYFVPRTKQSRIVLGRGESEGGTWKSTGKQVSIEDGNGRMVGYKRSLVFNKKVNGKPKPTNWLMTEFSLDKNGDEFKDLVLVWIRYKKNKKDNLGFNDAPRVDREHGEVPQLEGQHVDVDDFVNDLEGMLVEEVDTQQNTSDLDLLPPPPQQLEGQHGDLDDAYVDELERKLLEESDPQQEQENTSNFGLVPPPPQIHYNNDMMMLPPLPPYLQGQGFGFQTIMMTQSNGNDFFMQSYEKQSNHDNFFMQSNENDFLMQNNENVFIQNNNVLMQSNENNVVMQNNENNFSIPNNDNNENAFLIQNNDNNFYIPNNENIVFMQNNDNAILMQRNDNTGLMQNNGNDFMWNQEQKNRLDDLGYEGAEFVMLDIDKLLL